MGALIRISSPMQTLVKSLNESNRKRVRRLLNLDAQKMLLIVQTISVSLLLDTSVFPYHLQALMTSESRIRLRNR